MESHRAIIQKVKAYKPTAAALDSIRNVPLLFAVGISGVGKDTALKHLVASRPNEYQFMVSYTTRKRRENRGVMEQDGVEYHFIDFETAEAMLDRGDFVEVNIYADNVYGTGIAEIAAAKNAGKTIVKDVEVQGIENYVRLGMNVKPIFLLPPSYDVWWGRLISRYDDKIDQVDLHKRMKAALSELDQALTHDFYYLVINDTLDHTIDVIGAITRGEAVEKRPKATIELIRQISEEIKSRLATIDSSSLL